jgi:hypothetical protein
VSDWVRVTIIGPDTQTIDSRDVQDPWYQVGGHRHPDLQQQARDELAAEELREWLHRREPGPGVYVVWVTELDLQTHRTGRTWANVKIDHPAPSRAVA